MNKQATLAVSMPPSADLLASNDSKQFKLWIVALCKQFFPSSFENSSSSTGLLQKKMTMISLLFPPRKIVGGTARFVVCRNVLESGATSNIVFSIEYIIYLVLSLVKADVTLATRKKHAYRWVTVWTS